MAGKRGWRNERILFEVKLFSGVLDREPNVILNYALSSFEKLQGQFGFLLARFILKTLRNFITFIVEIWSFVKIVRCKQKIFKGNFPLFYQDVKLPGLLSNHLHHIFNGKNWSFYSNVFRCSCNLTLSPRSAFFRNNKFFSKKLVLLRCSLLSSSQLFKSFNCLLILLRSQREMMRIGCARTLNDF